MICADPDCTSDKVKALGLCARCYSRGRHRGTLPAGPTDFDQLNVDAALNGYQVPLTTAEIREVAHVLHIDGHLDAAAIARTLHWAGVTAAAVRVHLAKWEPRPESESVAPPPIPEWMASPEACIERVGRVEELAFAVRHDDPAEVLAALAGLDHTELMLLAHIALCAIPLDRSIDSMLAWTEPLAVAS